MSDFLHIRKAAALLPPLLLAWLLIQPGYARAAVVVAVVATQPEVPVAEVLDGFRRQFTAAGEDLDLRVYPLPGDTLEIAGQIARIQATPPQLIFVLGSRALNVIAREITGTPIVFGMVLNEQALPKGKNITGVYLDFPVATQLDWLHRLLPRAHNVGVIYNPAENAARIQAAAGIAKGLGLKLQAIPIHSPQELPAALEALANSCDVLWGLSDQMVANPQTARNLLLFSFRNRIPYFGLSAVWVEAGALFALERDYRDIGAQCAELAVKVIAGQAPENLPPQPPRRVLYTLNQRTAKQMKIELAAPLLRGAQKVY
jgi:putative tryptophan/tyrosine transport system substrate-binding protein